MNSQPFFVPLGVRAAPNLGRPVAGGAPVLGHGGVLGQRHEPGQAKVGHLEHEVLRCLARLQGAAAALVPPEQDVAGLKVSVEV